MRLIIWCFFLFPGPLSFAQEEINLKKVRKEIPIKGVKVVEHIDEDSNLLVFKTKTNKGLYDYKTKKILVDTLKFAKEFGYGKEILWYEGKNQYGLIRLEDRKELLRSTIPFNAAESSDTNSVLLTSTEGFGMLDLDRNDVYYVKPHTIKKKKVFFKQEYWNGWENYERSAEYNPTTGVLTYYGYSGDGITTTTNIYQEGKYLLETIAGYTYGGRAIEASTGRLVSNMGAPVESWKNGYSYGYSTISFWDFDFNILVDDVAIEKLSTEHLKAVFDADISSSRHIINGLYQIEKKGKIQFLSVQNFGIVSSDFDEVYEIGRDTYMGGISYFTRKGNKLGLFNTTRLETVPAVYDIVETRILPGGTYAYRAGSEFLMMGKENESYGGWELKSKIPHKGKRELDLTILVNHASIDGEKLILSLRKIDPDTHDSHYYTESNYEGGSGIFNWKTGRKIHHDPTRDFHTYQPYENGYIVQDHRYHFARRYTGVQLFDSSLNAITKPEQYRSPVVYEGKLYMLDTKSYQFVQYDIRKKKVVRLNWQDRF